MNPLDISDSIHNPAQQAVDASAVIVFVLTLLGHLPHIMAGIGSTLGVCWYLYLFYKEYKKSKK